MSIKPSATNENSSDSNSRGPQTLRQEIVEKIDQQMAEVLDSLPPAYFESLPEVEQLSHLKALMAFKICDIKHEIMLRRPDGRKITVISRENYPGYLAGLIRRLPDQGQLIGGKIFTSRDKEFIIDMFEFQPEGAYRTNVTISCGRQATIVAKVAELTGAPDQLVEEFIAHYHPENDILD